MKEIRLNKFLANSGVSSRRGADRLISEGKIKVNGKVVCELGVKIDPKKDRISFGKKNIKLKDEFVYYILNKPKGCISTAYDPKKRKKVIDLLPRNPRVFSVGRLDKESTGLLIMTNDGNLTKKVLHPRYRKTKTYEVEAEKKEGFEPNFVDKFIQGISLSDGLAKADDVKLIKNNKKMVKFNIKIHQGINRQIRRMCAKVGLKVKKLKRLSIADLDLGGLSEGSWTRIGKDKIYSLLGIKQ